jgi:hypothetical protein
VTIFPLSVQQAAMEVIQEAEHHPVQVVVMKTL